MTATESRLIDAVLALRAHKRAIADLWATREECEPVTAWDGQLEPAAFGRAPDVPGPRPDYCGKRLALWVEKSERTSEGAMEWRERATPTEAAGIIAQWCPACQRNSPKVLERKRLRKLTGGLASRVAVLARSLEIERGLVPPRARKVKPEPELPARCPPMLWVTTEEMDALLEGM